MDHDKIQLDSWEVPQSHYITLFTRPIFKIPFLTKKGKFYWKYIRKRIDPETTPFNKDFVPYCGSDWLMMGNKVLKRVVESDLMNHPAIAFIDEANKLKIDLLLKQDVKHIFNHENQFEIITEANEFNSRFVIITIGGFHKFDAYSWLIQLGHKIIKPVPSLFTFNIEEHLMKHLMGISVRGAKVKIIDTKQEFVGDILITHWGFSGPVVLKLSSFAAIELNKLDYYYEVVVNWINEKNTEEVRFQLLEYKEKHHLKNIENQLPYELPKRLWLYFFELIDLPPNTKWAEVPNKKINHLVEVLCNSRYKAKGKTTNKEEFVTSGGVDLKEVEMKTLESKKQKNLFFAGEVLNIDGITGGFNFQAAWSTAYLAAKLGNHDYSE
jgi:predicted Rossmann fold flavoprotein